MRTILLVDGYNIIGAWPKLRELKDVDLELARDLLISKMAEYQAFSGDKVSVIFDAHMVSGIGKSYKNHRVEVIYTKSQETADERIERMVRELKRIDTTIHVATSDFAEQSVIFGSGALRKSARELLTETDLAKKGIEKLVENTRKQQKSTHAYLSEELTEIFEKWRRGER
ncbi:NYN domain-containing protein [Alkalicoccobacillus murimartini]|uniref:RNA-binding protein with PIN domain n=1 Tax=Alkalicoccobacillus murimartini TaxID=171685 RepID=A0ABT9YP25_9BACI|nr:NYN domain-containing protein [Alkalicoccobacillus murimartini]MDQ0209250.1 putative RNA-binding protein with PIN domain [Alkalicoccobacillus murimartini]